MDNRRNIKYPFCSRNYSAHPGQKVIPSYDAWLVAEGGFFYLPEMYKS
jgi:hypothetical protein